MSYAFALVRVSASILAVVAGYLSWPIWTLAIAIPLHAAASYQISKITYEAVNARLSREQATEAEREWTKYYQAYWLRELALAFVKLGIGYALGFWLAALQAASPGNPQL